jgi:hypothetical protein
MPTRAVADSRSVLPLDVPKRVCSFQQRRHKFGNPMLIRTSSLAFITLLELMDADQGINHNTKIICSPQLPLDRAWHYSAKMSSKSMEMPYLQLLFDSQAGYIHKHSKGSLL